MNAHPIHAAVPSADHETDLPLMINQGNAWTPAIQQRSTASVSLSTRMVACASLAGKTWMELRIAKLILTSVNRTRVILSIPHRVSTRTTSAQTTPERYKTWFKNLSSKQAQVLSGQTWSPTSTQSGTPS